MQEIEGQIVEIIYQNETNGYTVCEFNTENFGDITIVRLFAFYYKRGYLKSNWKINGT